MTKTKQLLMVAIMLIACMPVAFALSNESPVIINDSVISVDNETPIDCELNTMNIPKGAIVRFIQLERQLDIKIQRAELLISELVEENTSPLEIIISELGLIKEEVSQYTTIESLSEMSVPEIAVLFIDLKNDSQGLIKEFKTIMHELLTEERINTLKTKAGLIKEAKDLRLKERIRAKIKDYNTERVRIMIGSMGVENETMIQELVTDNLNKSTVMNKMKEMYNKLGTGQKVNAAVKMVQKATQDKIKKRVSVEQLINDTEVRAVERLTNRLEKINEKENGVWSEVKEKITAKLGKKGNNQVSSASNINANIVRVAKAKGGKNEVNSNNINCFIANSVNHWLRNFK